MTDQDRVDRLRVMWNKSRNYFQSFLSELKGVRNSINDDRKFAAWCISDLHISLGVITNTANILKKADADIAKADLKSARDAERAEKKRKQQELAREKAIQREQQQDRKRKQVNAKRQRGYRQREKQKKLDAYANGATKNKNVIKFPDGELAKEIKSALADLNKSRQAWIDASVKLGVLLYEAHSRHPNKNVFGDWLTKHHIDIGKNDRVALISLGSNETAMRKALENTERSSYQLIWNEVQKQLPAS